MGPGTAPSVAPVPDYVVEFYLSRLDADAVGRAAERARSTTAAMAEDGTTVRYLRSVFLPEDETGFHFFQAASADLVRDAAMTARLPIDRVIEIITTPEGAS